MEILYTSDNTKGHFGVKKVIIIKGLYAYAYNDYNGIYGMSNYAFGIPISSKEEGDKIVKASNTNFYKTIIASTKWYSGYTEHSMFSYFKPNWYEIILEEQDKLDRKKKQKSERNLILQSKRKSKQKGGYRRSHRSRRRRSNTRIRLSRRSKRRSRR